MMELLIQEIVLSILLFVMGASSASFLFLLADRIHENYFSKSKAQPFPTFLQSILIGRSECNECHRTLSLLDLIPVINFLFNRGKCSECGFKIPFKYTLSELALGVLFVLVFIYRGVLGLSAYELVAFYIVLCVATLFTLIDLEIRKVPDLLIYPVIGILFACRVGEALFVDSSRFVEYLLSGFLSFLFIYIVNLLTKGKAFGWGDSKFVVAMGLLLGKYVLGAIYIGVIAGAVIGVITYLVNSHKSKSRDFNKFTIPFIPFLAFGTVVMYLFGNELIGGFLNDLSALVEYIQWTASQR